MVQVELGVTIGTIFRLGFGLSLQIDKYLVQTPPVVLGGLWGPSK